MTITFTQSHHIFENQKSQTN